MERPPRFRLPREPRTPLLLFAGGTGLSPFRGFLQERARQPAAGPVWLFVSARSPQEVCYREELADLAAAGCQVRVAVSRDTDLTGLRGLSGRRGHVADLLRDEADGRALWQLLQGEGEPGGGGRVYVCGNAGFASSVAAALQALVRRHTDGPARPDPGAEHLRRMLAEGRYVEELYTTHADPARSPHRLLDVSELVLHNGAAGGSWTAIGGRVYDISGFLHEHPGGATLLQGYAGMDATHAFEQVGHRDRPDVAAHLPRYELGALRQLALGREWGVSLVPSGLRTQDLDDAHATWVRVLYLVVEMQNAFANDLAARGRPTSRGSSALADAYGLQLAVETHGRFLGECVWGLTGEPLTELWTVTSGLCAPDQDVRLLPRLLDVVAGTAVARTTAGSTERLLADLDAVVAGPDPAAFPRLHAVCRGLHARDTRFVDDVKLALRGGVRVFEELRADTVRRGAARLVAAALEPVDLLHGYCTDVVALLGPGSP